MEVNMNIRGCSKPTFYIDTYAFYPTNLHKVRRKHRVFKHR